MPSCARPAHRPPDARRRNTARLAPAGLASPPRGTVQSVPSKPETEPGRRQTGHPCPQGGWLWAFFSHFFWMPGLGVRGFKRATDIVKENCARKDAKTTFFCLFSNPKILVQGFHSFLCDFGRFASSKTLRAHCEQLDVVIIEIYIQAVGFDNHCLKHT